ncbi:MAG: alpha/beta hydrolase [Gemmatimonadaceae bacterium]|nr:alpha/beta hydrolase [Gemmatimonadaceae bacterium]
MRRSTGAVLGQILLTLALSACAARAPMPMDRAPRRDTVWYVAIRNRSSQRSLPRADDSLEYGLALFRAPHEQRAGSTGDLTFESREVLSAAAFHDALQQRVRRPRETTAGAVLYVHGFATSISEAWEYTATAQQFGGAHDPWIAFAWPSHGHGITWPRRGAWFSQAYREDSASTVISQPAFARALMNVVDAVGGEALTVTAHSLGGQLVGNVLASDTAVRRALQAQPLRALAFLVPDVEAERFRDSLLPTFAAIAHRRVLYVSGRDRALALARRVSGSTRAGQRVSPPLAPDLTETVDITDALTTEGWFQRLVGTHHAVRRLAGVLFDVANVVAGGRDPICREQVGTGVRQVDGTWMLRRVPNPRSAELDGCPPFRTEATR